MSNSDGLAQRTAVRAAREVAARFHNTPGMRELQRQLQSAAMREAVSPTRPLFDQATTARIVRYGQVHLPQLTGLTHLGEVHGLAVLARVTQYATAPNWDAPVQRAMRHSGFPGMPSTQTLLGLDRIRTVFDNVITRRRGEAGWWLADNIDPFQPSQVTGLHDKLPTDRCYCLSADEHLAEFVKAVLHHSHRRLSEPPGRLVTARGHLTRGPNTHWSTQHSCRPVGLVRA
ncbi:hypothetical protein [Nocardia altamirensis]|uniref:hypothetical protein n=1 Tax=Nocardia altamirensis TaxID=472158 RepID=UPI00083FEBAA|nr:hypothetical protein [Nocardia altamirensis]